MPEILFPAPWRATDGNGDPVPSAEARFFRTDTTTLETVYADEAGTVAHPDPLIADGSGVFPPVFNTSAFGIRVDVRDPDTDTSLPGYPNNLSLASETATGSAASTSFSPTTNIPETNVQAAIERADQNWRDARTGSDDGIISGTPGANTNLVAWNSDGDAVDSGYNVIDEDDFISDSDTAVPTQQSTKTYVDNLIATVLPSFVFLEEFTASNDATIDFTAFDASQYISYRFFLQNVIPSTDAVTFFARVSNDGGTSFISSNSYRYAGNYAASDVASGGVHASASNTAHVLTLVAQTVGSSGGETGVSGTLDLVAPDLSTRTRFVSNITYASLANVILSGFANGEQTTAEAHDAIRFQFTSGNIESGRITMYGLRGASA